MVVQNTGVVYDSSGKLDRVEAMQNRVLARYEKTLKLEQPDTLGVVQNLGKQCYGCGELGKAKEMWKQVVAGYEKELEPEHPDMLGAVQNLAKLYNIFVQLYIIEKKELFKQIMQDIYIFKEHLQLTDLSKIKTIGVIISIYKVNIQLKNRN